MTDDGACYKPHAFGDVLRAGASCAHEDQAVWGETNSKVERLSLTLTNEWAYVVAYDSTASV